MCGYCTPHLELPLIIVPFFFWYWLLSRKDADLRWFGDLHLTLSGYCSHGGGGFSLDRSMNYFLGYNSIFPLYSNSLPFIRNGLSPLHPTSQLFDFLHFGTKLLQQLHHLISTLLLFLLKPPGFCFQPLQPLLSMISLMHHVHYTLS